MNQDFSLFEQRLIEAGYDSDAIEQILEVAKNSIYPKKYGLVWEEKTEMIKENLKLQIPYLEELEEREIKLVEPNSPQHLLIEGDNYEALKLLQTTHRGKVNVIYIDPPYNTGNRDFKYNDHYLDKDDAWKHSYWLSFMHKRLILAKELMSEDGVIFISIDDNEMAQLKLLCDEVFGENNFIANVIRKENAKKQKIGKPNIKTEFEYLLVYSKCFTDHFKYIEKSEYLKYSKLCSDLYSSLKKTHENPKKIFNQLLKGELPENYLSKSDFKKLKQIFTLHGESKGLSMYKYIDEHGVYRNSDLNMYFGKGFDYNIINPFNGNSFLKRPKHLLPSKEKFLQTGLFAENEDGNIYFTNPSEICEIESKKFDYGCLIFKENNIIEYKNYLDTLSNPESILSNFMGSDDKLMQSMNLSFSYPKRVDFIKYLLSIFYKDNAIILDFFAGSGTTGHAVLELNQKDGGNRQFILCTNNENNICEEVTYERLKRVMNGYTTSKGKEVEGLPANLKYLKVGMLEKETYTDEDLSRLYMPHVLPLLQLKHNAFTLVSETKHGWVFEGDGFRFGLADSLATKRDFDQLKEHLESYEGGKILYLFSTDTKSYPKYKQLASLEEFIKPIPREMLELLKGE